MSRIKSILIAALSILFLCNLAKSDLCARLKSVSAGETHTLALTDDNSLFACGAGPLGLGVSGVCSLKPVKGENGVGYLKNSINFAKAFLGFIPQALAQSINSAMSTRLLATSQL